MDRIVAVNSNCYHGYSIEEAIDGISKAGFRYIELTATKGWTEHVFPTMSLAYLSTVKERCKEKGIIPIALSGHCNLMDEKRIPDFLENMKVAHYFGCQYIVSSIGEAHLENNAMISDSEVAKKLTGLIPYLKEYNLQLVLEIHGKEHGSGKKIKQILEKVNCDLIGINYDTANAIFYGKVDLMEDMDDCIKQIQYMHLKDKAGKIEEWNFPALGEGIIDFSEVKKKMDAKNNTAPFSVEIEFTKEGASNVEEVNRALLTSYQYLKTLGLQI